MKVIKSKYGNSSFWLDKFDTDLEEDFLTDVERENNNLFALASRKRAISNYVSILTGENIPVKFKTRGDSYTDGDHIVISSKIEDPQDFDVAVGLALHEASHIKLSDFKFLNDMKDIVDRRCNEGEVAELLTKHNIFNSEVYDVVKDILNYVEDRRIDNFVYKTSPGYRDYYIALYDKFFNNSLVEKGLQSDEYTSENFESYMFRLINLHSKNTRLDALKGLREIYQLINLRTIGRLKTSQEAFELAWTIFTIMLKTIDDSVQNNQQDQQGDPSKGDGGNGKSQDGETQVVDGDENDEMGDGGSVSSQNYPQVGQKSSEKSKTELSDKQKDLLSKKIQKQKDFLNGQISKRAISKKDEEKIDLIDQSDAEIKHVGKDYVDGYGRLTNGIECIVVKKVNEQIAMSEEFPFASTDWYGKGLKNPYQEQVDNGIRLGTILSKKLQTRSESRDTIFNRQKTGKIDRRMISSLGFGNENVFFTRDIDFYNDANLHISIDASGSMNGDKWERTLTNVVALCKAVDMIPNLQIQVSLRSCKGSKPYIALVYDSRKDTFLKVKKLFPCFHVSGTTPEGLTFEAILDEMVKGNGNIDSYFLNISDGEPYFQGKGFYYSGQEAAKHTKKMVNQINDMGIKVISYFVSDSEGDSWSKRMFGMSYGKSANYIDVTSVNQVSRTMNKLFMQKKNS